MTMALEHVDIHRPRAEAVAPVGADTSPFGDTGSIRSIALACEGRGRGAAALEVARAEVDHREATAIIQSMLEAFGPICADDRGKRKPSGRANLRTPVASRARIGRHSSAAVASRAWTQDDPQPHSGWSQSGR